MPHAPTLVSLLRLSSLSLLAALTGWAQTTRTWDGDTDANLGGDWSVAANWSDNDVPNTVSERASLPDVTLAGVRTVVNDDAHTINQLIMAQTTAGGVNRLRLDAPLTISGNATPFSLNAGAGVASLVVNLNGQALKTTAGSLTGVNLAGTWNLSSGSDLELEFTNNNGNAVLNLAGNVSLDGATITYDWAAGGNNSGTRNFSNSGLFVLDNNSALLFTSSTGRPTGGGFGNLANNTNSGTMRVLGGSTVVSSSLTNTGTLELGGGGIVGGSMTTPSLTNQGILAITGSGAVKSTLSSGTLSATLVNDNAGILNLGSTGAPASLLIETHSAYLTNRGAVVLEPGSTITLKVTNNQGSYRFNNSGTFTQDNVDLVVDWAITSGSNGTTRDFVNSGIWTLENGAKFNFISSTGYTNFGFGNLTSCTNSGTLNVDTGASVAFRGLTNTGTINLGAGAELGTSVFSGMGIVFTNGANGSLLVAGSTAANPARIGFVNESLQQTLFNNGSASATGASLMVGTGSDQAVLAIQGSGNGTQVQNFADNTIAINGGATLAILANDDGLPHPHNYRYARLVNQGQFDLGGTLAAQPNHNSGLETVLDNYGTVTVISDSASLERLAAASSVYARTRLYNQVGGTIGGTGILTHVNSTGNSGIDRMVLTNAGTIAPGASIGTLEFVNTDLHLLAGSVYAFEASSASNHDLLIVTNGNLTLDNGWILDLVRLSGYSWPGETFTLFEVDGGSISLGTPSVLFNPADRWGGTPIVSVVGSQVVLSGVYIIPEPSSLALLALGLLARRRRRRG